MREQDDHACHSCKHTDILLHNKVSKLSIFSIMITHIAHRTADSVSFSVIGFLAGAFITFKPSLFTTIASSLMIFVVVILLIILAISSYSSFPWLAPRRPRMQSH